MLARRMKTAVSLLLCTLLLCGLLVPVGAAVQYEMQDIPLITVPGTSNTWVYKKDGTRIVPGDKDPTSALTDRTLLESVLKAHAKSMLTNNWTFFCDAVYDAFVPLVQEQALDKNGEPTEGEYLRNSWSKDTILKKTSNFGANDYFYYFDHRLDPFAVADDFNDYIDAVLEVTGAEKVAILGRCYGACVVAAYLQRYGTADKIDTCVMYCPMVTGIEYLDAMFTGNIVVNPDDTDRFADYYLKDKDLLGDDALTDLVTALISLMNDTGTLDVALDVIVWGYHNIKEMLLPPILRDTYATWPCYWAMVNDDYFDEALQFVFGGYEEEYAGLIEKVRTYHDSVQVPLFDILDGLMEDGMKICVLGKYNTPQYPLYDGANAQSDNSNSLERMTFGATASPIDGVLSDAYVRKAVQNGSAKYISPDFKIDASTCRYPDNTWFIKNAGHLDHQQTIMDVVMYSVQRKTQATVWDDPRFPQYTQLHEDHTLTPVTGSDATDQRWNRSFFDALRTFFSALSTLFTRWVRGLFQT